MGPMLAKAVRKCEGRACSNFWNAGNMGQPDCHLFPKGAAGGEHEFISATKIGRFGDIAVMAQIQRNVGIAVALSGSEVPRGIAIAKKDVTMKTTKLLTAVSAAALLGISSFALAQGTGGGAGSSGTSGGAG